MTKVKLSKVANIILNSKDSNELINAIHNVKNGRSGKFKISKETQKRIKDE